VPTVFGLRGSKAAERGVEGMAIGSPAPGAGPASNPLVGLGRCGCPRASDLEAVLEHGEQGAAVAWLRSPCSRRALTIEPSTE